MEKITQTRKGGFTLVELLIVIVIIGILAGMMMLTMGSATDGADASKLVNDLRLLKSSSLLYYADNDKWPDQVATGVGGADFNTSLLNKYVDKSFAGNYVKGDVTVKKIGDKIFYGLTPSPDITTKAKEKLAKNGGVYTETGSNKDTDLTAVKTFYMSVR
ncbi:MAG: prepilin-type N-terminal cleavage/methylation domain-containing protein [Synergistaceae bacterium]|jgi:general secretion pathway protein G|nr:prepilin-type N-terminal cleavage/methylation domain-containing protein [Synergistaceae bacterium]